MKKVKKSIIQAIEYLKQNPTISIRKIATLFNCERHTIKKYKDIYTLYNVENASDETDEYMYYFTEEELKILQYFSEHQKNESYNSFKLKFPNAPERRSLYRHLDILGLDYFKGNRIKYHYNREKFKTIETEEDAYWLGFLTADGCIIEGKWLQLQLAEKDKEHIKKFCRYLEMPEDEIEEIIKDGFGGAYTRDNPINCVKICSLQIIENLKDKGIMPQKSGKEKPYYCSTPELEKAYIRGLIDGDGYIRETQYGMGLVGSFEICEYVYDFINNNIIDISNNHIREHGTIYKMELTGRIQTSIILHELYDNASIALDRKLKLVNGKY